MHTNEHSQHLILLSTNLQIDVQSARETRKPGQRLRAVSLISHFPKVNLCHIIICPALHSLENIHFAMSAFCFFYPRRKWRSGRSLQAK